MIWPIGAPPRRGCRLPHPPLAAPPAARSRRRATLACVAVLGALLLTAPARAQSSSVMTLEFGPGVSIPLGDYL